MRQRVVIAMAIALKPSLLIADEPTTALDVTVQAQVMDLLATLKQETGMALLLISHDLGVVADIADRVVVMYAGKVVEEGPIRTVYDTASHPYTRALLTSIPRMDVVTSALPAIPGSPPSPYDRPPGCAFAARCPLARPRCVEDVPELRLLGSDHRSACHFAEEARES
jgi:oligopeptide transport system ATP-binding protein